MKKSLLIHVLCFVVLSASATQYSCLSIITESKAIGKWSALKAWISAADLEDEWGKCQYVSDDYPQFSEITNALVASGIVDLEEVMSILSKSADTAVPDNALRRIYENDNKTHSGRKKWHGMMVSQIIDTNKWIRITRYEDGTVFTDSASKPKDKIHTMKKVVAETNGIPVRLASARQRWACNKNSGGVTNVTVNLEAGK